MDIEPRKRRTQTHTRRDKDRKKENAENFLNHII